MDCREVSESSSAEAPSTTAPGITASSTVTPPANPRASTPTTAAKIISRNSNGTVVMTSSPANEAELQLYRVMQRASLLAYYDTLLEMGGDDVQQLCDAGEEEFLEIMALVGMASKPLHVRRLQKALQEWVANPGLFQVPLFSSVPTSPVASSHSNPTITVPAVTMPRLPPSLTPTPPVVPSVCMTNHVVTPPVKEMPRSRSPQLESVPSTSPGPGPGSPLQLTPVLLESQISRLAEAAEALVKTLPKFEPKPHNTKKKICRDLENVMTMSEDNPRRMEEIRKYAAIYGRFDCKRKPEKPLTLHEVSVNEAAAQICRFSPALLTRRDELFPLARQVVRDSGYHYSKTHASLTPIYRSHYPLGSRNGEENYKRPRLDAHSPPLSDCSDLERSRRQDRLEAITEELRSLGERTEELVLAAQQVRENNDLGAVHALQQQMEIVQNKQTQLLLEQSDLLKQPLPMRFYRRNSTTRSAASISEADKGDTDDTDSQLSFSNASSPSQEIGDSRDSLVDGINNAISNGKSTPGLGGKGRQSFEENDDGSRYGKQLSLALKDDGLDSFHEAKVQVISASGGNIIAVANPALSMSSAIRPSAEDLPCLRSDSPMPLRIERESPKLPNPD